MSTHTNEISGCSCYVYVLLDTNGNLNQMSEAISRSFDDTTMYDDFVITDLRSSSFEKEIIKSRVPYISSEAYHAIEMANLRKVSVVVYTFKEIRRNELFRYHSLAHRYLECSESEKKKINKYLDINEF